METTKTNLANESDGPLAGDLAETYRYWDGLRNGGIGPAWRDFNLAALPPTLIPWCTVVDVINEPLDFKFRFWGTARVALQGRELTSRSVNDLMPPQFAAMVFANDMEVVETKSALHTISTFEAEDVTRGSYEFLLLPFSDDTANVTAILTASSYNEAAIRHMYRVLGTRQHQFSPCAS